MPAEIVTGEFCASWFGTYEFKGSGDSTYHTTIGGTETPVFCDCPGFKFQKKPVFDRECKHTRRVHKEACLWNCQWHDGNDVKLRPAEVDERTIPGQECPNCGGPVVPVRIAV